MNHTFWFEVAVCYNGLVTVATLEVIADNYCSPGTIRELGGRPVDEPGVTQGGRKAHETPQGASGTKTDN